MGVHIPFSNSYASLPERFYARLPPTPVKEPELVQLNRRLAIDLGLDIDEMESSDGVAILAGNAVPDGAAPLAQAYAGHQFGGWVPQLGDGRAILLGEVVDRDGVRRDIQLKGSGRTPYSRMGDGRAWLGPVLREYIVSEAMYGLGIPTTRALAAVRTGETVLREAPYPGAVLTRVAQSHIRVGTFQYFAARQDEDALKALTQHVIERHYPEAATALDLLHMVIARQAKLVAMWMGVGFIHGVMNTDNTQIAGETIDYGPCAFMDDYRADRVYSSIDQFGRYAYNKQPDVLVWNLAQFATALLPVMDLARDAAIEAATEAVNEFLQEFRTAWLRVFGAKIGLAEPTMADATLIHQLLDLMEAGGADFTNTFRKLGTDQAEREFDDPAAFRGWTKEWEARLSQETRPAEDVAAGMYFANPAYIPRNHLVEQAIQSAVEGKLKPFERLVRILANPYDEQPNSGDLMRPPAPEEEVRQTFCGT